MRKLLLTPIAAGLVLAGATPAFAWEEFSITPLALETVAEWNNGTIVDISSIPSPASVPTPYTYYAGQFSVAVAGTNSSHGGSLLNGSSFYTYCVELTQTLASPTDLAMN